MLRSSAKVREPENKRRLAFNLSPSLLKDQTFEKVKAKEAIKRESYLKATQISKTESSDTLVIFTCFVWPYGVSPVHILCLEHVQLPREDCGDGEA